MAKNVASGNDRVAIQVGKVHGRSGDKPAPAAPAASGPSVNVRSGNARVGKQTDVVRGDVQIKF